jgi:hypothetical protein
VVGLNVRWVKLWDDKTFDPKEFARLNATKQVLRSVLVTLPETDPNAKRFAEVLGQMM